MMPFQRAAPGDTGRRAPRTIMHAILRRACVASVLGLCAPAPAQQPSPPDSFGPPPGFDGPAGGPMQRGDRPVLAHFDADRDGRLDVEERKDARAWLHDNPLPRGGPGGFGPPGSGPRDAAEPQQPRRGGRVTPADVPHHPDRPLFDPDIVRTVFLQFAADDWFEELTDFYRTDVDIPCEVIVDGATLRDVGVHMRGNTSFQGVRGQKKSLHLDFDFTVAGQQLLGHAAINLINNHEDPSLLHETIGAWVANRHGEAPRASLVRVVVNGEDLGVYSQVEHFGKDFLAEHFGSKKGSRFKVPPDFSGGAALKDLGDDLAAYRRAYQLKSKDDPQAWQQLRELCGLLATADDAQLERELPQRLDVDGALWFLAVDNALLDGDGYYSRGSDYSLWLDERGRFHVLPRDGNEVLGAGGPRRGPGGAAGPGDRVGPPGDPAPNPRGNRGGRGRGPGGMRMPTVDQPALAMADDPSRPLIRRLLGIAAWRERYLACLRTLLTETLAPAVLLPRIEAWRRLAEPLARQDAHSLDGFAAFEQAFTDGPRALTTILRTRHEKLSADPALQGPWPQIRSAAHAIHGGPGGPLALRVTATADQATATMTLHLRTDRLAPFAAVPMHDDGEHGDGSRGDGVFGVTTGELPPAAELGWFVTAAASTGRVAMYPSAGGSRPTAVTLPGAASKGKKKAGSKG